MTTPTLETMIADALQSALEQTFTAAPGTVVDYDATRSTATIQPATRRPIADQEGAIAFEPMAPMCNVPVCVTGTQTMTTHSPLAAGDTVLLVWLDYSPAAWRRSGEVSDAGDTHAHGPGYAVAIPWATGWRTNPDADDSIGRRGVSAARLHFESTFVRAGGGASFVALATLVTSALNALKSAITSAAATEAGASGLGGMTALNTALSAWPTPVASTNLKAD